VDAGNRPHPRPFFSAGNPRSGPCGEPAGDADDAIAEAVLDPDSSSVTGGGETSGLNDPTSRQRTPFIGFSPFDNYTLMLPD